MLPEFKFTISDNNKILGTVNQVADEKNLIDSIQSFQAEVNACLTKMIEELGDTGGDCNIDDEDGDSEEEDHSIPKKKKNS